VQVDVKERTVDFTGSFATVRSGQRCPLGGKGYCEIEILEIDNTVPQYGFAAPAFGRVLGASGEGVGDDAHSWAVDGTRQLQWHKGQKAWKCKWRIGDVIGLACDLDKMQMHVSLNGSFAAPNGVSKTNYYYYLLLLLLFICWFLVIALVQGRNQGHNVPECLWP
jgi:hypothetical protein